MIEALFINTWNRYNPILHLANERAQLLNLMGWKQMKSKSLDWKKKKKETNTTYL